MRNIWFTLCFLLVSFSAAMAQNTITGTVVDTSGTTLPSATVLVLNPADESLVSFGLTDGIGAFKVQRIPKGEFILRVTYIGYANLNQKITFEGSKEVKDMGTLKLESESALIDEVTVTGERNPIEIKEDTIEFNANSFRTQPNAVVEDLLKQLPGVEVERDGSVKAQGEDVERVLVDGKEFFGRDPKIATKNLPANAVDKVQVFDGKSDQAQFTGIDDGEREKTINLTLKEGKKKGAFGTISAGYGDAGRFASNASINSFSNKTQVSFIGTGNNINEQGFSQSDYNSFSGSSGGRRFQRGGRNTGGAPISSGNDRGIATTFAGGLNLNHEFTEKTKLNLSYFYSNFDKQTITNTREQIFLNDNGDFVTNELSTQDDLNTNHSLNLRFDSDLDSMSSVLVRGNFTYNATDANSILGSTSNLIDGTPTNASDQTALNNGDVLRGNGSVLYRRKFKKGGRNFSLNATYGLNNNDALGNNSSVNTFFVEQDGQILTSERLLNQDFDDLSEVDSYSAKLTYTEPLGKRRYLEFNYQHSKNQNDVDRAVFDLSNGERIYNEQLSNLYRSGYTYNNFGINFLLNRQKFNLTIGATLQNSLLDGELLLADQTITQDLTNLLPRLSYRYSFTSTKNLSLDYTTNVNEPTIQQLQPIVDNSNPLNIYVGNPDLRPEFRHNIRLRFFSFNPGNFSNFFSILTFTYSNNKIQNTQLINEQLIRTTTPVNVSDDYRVNLFTNYGTRFNKLQFRFNVSPSMLFTRGIVFVNDVQNDITSLTPGVRVRFDNQKKEKIDIGFGGRFNYTTTEYSISSEQNQAFINHSYFTDLTLTFSESVNFSSNFDYTIFSGITDDFSQDVPIWNASVSFFFLKGKKGQLRLGVNDILDENRGVSRVNDANSIIDEQVNALGRYYLATFTYALRGFDSNNSGGRGGDRRRR